MDTSTKRTAVGGLRKATPTMIAVLAQDVLQLPLGQIDRGTLFDLMALSEVAEDFAGTLRADLEGFRARMVREMGDLPDGPALVEFANAVKALPPESAPATFRTAFTELTATRRQEDAVAAMTEAIAAWEGSEPDSVTVLKEAKVAPPKASTGAGKSKIEKVAAKKKPVKKRTRSSSQVDERRGEWIQEDSTTRLKVYGARGLKEAVVVAGCRHRSPWPDLTEAEVLATLRRLKREDILRFSAGRWFINS